LIGLHALRGYKVTEKIADGGSGEIYKAEDLGAARPVVLKILHPRHYGNPREHRRLEREGRLGLRLGSHANIVATYAAGQLDGIPYLILEFAPGACLRAMLQAGRRLDEIELLCLAVALTRALRHIHRVGIYHKDIKPDNLVLDGLHSIKLLDLGLAERARGAWLRSLLRRRLEGSPAYMAPELIRHKRASRATDIYALGATLYEAATGFVPYPGTSLQEILAKQMDPFLRPAPIVVHNPRISFTTQRMIGRALSKDPAARYRTADELWLELSRHPVVRHGDVSC
jgi:serine/threonine-protein kinase